MNEKEIYEWNERKQKPTTCSKESSTNWTICGFFIGIGFESIPVRKLGRPAFKPGQEKSTKKKLIQKIAPNARTGNKKWLTNLPAN